MEDFSPANTTAAAKVKKYFIGRFVPEFRSRPRVKLILYSFNLLPGKVGEMALLGDVLYA